MSKETNAATVQPASPVELKKIHVPYDWNSRAERNVQDMADTESAGFDGFMTDIQHSGQLTPVILRNTHGVLLSGKKTDLPYEAICGFRRIRAITLLNSGQHAAEAKSAKRPCVPGLPDGTINAEVRDVKDKVEARILNGKENTLRKNMKAEDLVFLVKDLSEAKMTQVPIAEALGITQGWVSKLLKVASLPQPILDHWRDAKPIAPVQTKNDGVFELKADPKTGKVATSRQLTEPEMRGLADLKSSPEEVIARYIRMVKPQTQGEGPGAATPQPVDKVKAEVIATAALMGALCRAGVLENGTLDWGSVIGPKKDGYPIECGKDKSQEYRLSLADAAREAFEAEVSKVGAAKRKSNEATAETAN